MNKFKRIFTILALTLATWLHVQAQEPPTNGLVAYYPFNGNANDASGNGRHGSIIGNDKRFIGDRPGFSLWLNTSSAPALFLPGTYVSVPKSSSLDFNGDFTLSVWVNFTNSTPLPNPSPDGFPQNLISNGEDSGALNLRVLTDSAVGKDLVQFLWGGPSSSISVLLNSPRKIWWQITVVRSGSNLTLYKDATVLTTGFVLPTVNNSTIWLGQHQSNATYPLFGGIDDVRMYNSPFKNSLLKV